MVALEMQKSRSIKISIPDAPQFLNIEGKNRGRFDVDFAVSNLR